MSYAQDAINARAILKRKGQTCRVRVYTDVYNKVTSKTTRAKTDSNVYGVIFDFPMGPNGTKSVAGTEVEQGDRRLYLAAGTVIEPGTCSILVDSVEYQVVGVGVINPAGTVVMYDLHLRK